MTKAELLKLLEPFTDDQYVYVCLHDEKSLAPAVQITIQGVQATDPWHPQPDSKQLVGLQVHARNAQLSSPCPGCKRIMTMPRVDAAEKCPTAGCGFVLKSLVQRGRMEEYQSVQPTWVGELARKPWPRTPLTPELEADASVVSMPPLETGIEPAVLAVLAWNDQGLSPMLLAIPPGMTGEVGNRCCWNDGSAYVWNGKRWIVEEVKPDATVEGR